MPNGDLQENLKLLSPEQQVAVMQTRQAKERIAQQDQQLKFNKLKTAIDTKLAQKRIQLQEAQQEAMKEYRASQTDLAKREANRLAIKNQTMQQLQEKSINTPYGEMNMLQAMTLGIRPSTPEQTKMQLKLEDIDGRKKGIIFDPSSGSVTTMDLGKTADEAKAQPRKWETLAGKIEEGSQEVESLYGASEFLGLSPDVVPKSSTAKSLMAGYVRADNNLTGNEAAIKAVEETNKFFGSLGNLSKDMNRTEAIKAVKDLVQQAVDARNFLQQQGVSVPAAFSGSDISAKLANIGYNQEQIQDVLTAAVDRIRQERRK